MSLVQDFFGAAPKTVLNKPFMHVQDQKVSGTQGGTSSVGDNVRDLNTVITNEISGASLNTATSEVTLPAGTYYVQASAPVRYNVGDLSSRTDILASSGTRLYGEAINNNSYNSPRSVIGGEITLSASGTITVISYAEGALVTNGLGATSNMSPYEVYTDLKIWKLDSNIETPVLSDPTMVAARPLMHVQDQKPSGTTGGTSVVGMNDRDLNTVLTNEISGASLASNEVTLPAGKYRINYSAPARANNGNLTSRVHLLVNGTTVDVSQASYTGNAASNYISTRGEGLATLNLSTASTISIQTYHAAAVGTDGLGPATSQAPYEVYADLRIWQLDALRQTPVIVNDKLYPLPGTTLVTGNMHGLEYAYTTANSITIQPGICMDSTNNVVLDLPSAQVLSIGTTINEIYNLFLCNDNVVRTDTDVDGANLGAYTSIRWIGFVLTDSSGDVLDFNMNKSSISFRALLEVASAPSPAQLVDFSSFFPAARIEDYTILVIPSGASSRAYFYGVTDAGVSTGAIVARLFDTTTVESTLSYTTIKPFIWADYASTTGGVKIASVRLKR